MSRFMTSQLLVNFTKMPKDILHTRSHGERVTSTYTEIYLDDDYCDYKIPVQEHTLNTSPEQPSDENIGHDIWISPSDLLIGKIELQPPFTSKITRGITHEGILSIGNGVLENERAKFLYDLYSLIQENNSAWSYVLKHERRSIWGQVKKIYDKIYLDKSKIMAKEISKFYENTLQELEDHMTSEIRTVLTSAHTNIISDFNTTIKSKLAEEKKILENALEKKYNAEVKKIKHYYKLILDNEKYRNNKLINHALHERNDLLNAFLRQMEAEKFTSTMYIMCAERKKCKIKKFLLENYQTAEILDSIKKIKDKQNKIDDYKKRETGLTQINTHWEDKITKVLQLFLKFISFSLKLLPEQTTFLLDLEKMVVLQLKEMQKSPKICPILVDSDNLIKFEECKAEEEPCDKKPFIVVGDVSDTPPRVFGSRETIPSDVDLPFLRLQRQFVYAKCHKFDEIKAFLELQRCKCGDIPMRQPSESPPDETPKQSIESLGEIKSSNESMFIDDIMRFNECPVRQCKDWVNKMSFPHLNSYLDFTEENYERCKAILGKPIKKDEAPELVSAQEVVFKELPFSVTKELYHNVETQYSSQEDLNAPEIECPCTGKMTEGISVDRLPQTSTEMLNQLLIKRKISLRRLMNENPRLLKMLNDEDYDYQF